MARQSGRHNTAYTKKKLRELRKLEHEREHQKKKINKRNGTVFYAFFISIFLLFLLKTVFWVRKATKLRVKHRLMITPLGAITE